MAELAPTRIEVTAGHIERGVSDHPRKCPIALAVLEQHPEMEGELRVLTDRVILLMGGKVCSEADLPDEAISFVFYFDQRDHVAPIEFDLTWREFKP